MANEAQFPSESVEIMASELHDPAFFDKLGTDWKLEPRTPQEREQLLELALHLRSVKDVEMTKSAAQGNQFLAGAIDSLKVAMHAQGLDTTPTSDGMAVRKLAAQLSTNPRLQKAAIDYGTYLATAGQAGAA